MLLRKHFPSIISVVLEFTKATKVYAGHPKASYFGCFINFVSYCGSLKYIRRQQPGQSILST